MLVFLMYYFEWDKVGVVVLGKVEVVSGYLFIFCWLFKWFNMVYICEVISIVFLIVLLGFFELFVVVKSLGGVLFVEI